MLLFYVGFFISISLLTYAISGIFQSKENKVEQRIETYFDSEAAAIHAIAATEQEKSFYERLILPTWKNFKRQYNRRLRSEEMSELEKQLLQAGQPWGFGPVEFKLFRLLLMIVVPLVTVSLSLLIKLPILLVIAIGVASLTMSFALPNFFLKKTMEERGAKAVRELPDILDLLTISLEAGLGFDGAISQVVKRKKGVLSDEFKITLEEIRLGKTRREALNAMNDRILADELQTLIYSIVQAEKLGIGMVAVLRVQTEDMRERRRQKAEETAMKAPIKMLFPLVIFIFPSLFVVLLGPALIQFLGSF